MAFRFPLSGSAHILSPCGRYLGTSLRADALGASAPENAVVSVSKRSSNYCFPMDEMCHKHSLTELQ